MSTPLLNAFDLNREFEKMLAELGGSSLFGPDETEHMRVLFFAGAASGFYHFLSLGSGSVTEDEGAAEVQRVRLQLDNFFEERKIQTPGQGTEPGRIIVPG